MRVLCLNPPFKTEHGRFSRESRSPAITKSGTNYYPIWLAYVAGTVEAAGHDVKLFDSCADRVNEADTVAMARDFGPDLIVLDTCTPSILNDLTVGSALKAAFPDSFIVLMGTHPSSLPEETLRLGPTIDAIARNEADFTVREIAEKLHGRRFQRLPSERKVELLQSVEGLSFQVDGRTYHNPMRPLIKDLDALPFASAVYKKHLNIRNYFFAACDYPEVQIMSARGCTDRCTFCVYPYAMHDLKYRTRSAKNVVDEFEWVELNLPEVKEIGIEDDTFAGSIKRVHEFCEEKIRRGIRLKWYTNVRATLDYETLRLMRKANCVLLTVGYESANQAVLDKMKKRMKAESIVNFSRDTKRAGIMVHSCFMVGNPGDTRATLQESLDLALRLNDDTMQFFPLIVYPGTPDYEWAKSNHLLTVTSYDQWVTEEGLHNSVVRMPDMDSREIVEWCDYARRRYYVRPRYLAYKAWQTLIRPSEIVRNVKAAKRFWWFLWAGTFGGRRTKDPAHFQDQRVPVDAQKGLSFPGQTQPVATGSASLGSYPVDAPVPRAPRPRELPVLTVES